MIGDAPVPVKWVYSRKSKKVLNLDFNSSNELCNPSNFPDDVNFVMKGLSKKIKSKAKADKLKIHRQVGVSSSVFLILFLEIRSAQDPSSYSTLHVQEEAE